MLTFKLILERENSNNKAVCNEMFDLYVDGTKIEISRFFSDLNVPLPKYSFIKLHLLAEPRQGYCKKSLNTAHRACVFCENQ